MLNFQTCCWLRCYNCLCHTSGSVPRYHKKVAKTEPLLRRKLIGLFPPTKTLHSYSDSFDSPVWFSCVILLCDSPVWFSCVILLCDSAVWFCCVILLCDSAVWFCCVILLCDSAVWFCCVILLCDSPVWFCCVILLCDSAEMLGKLISWKTQRSKHGTKQWSWLPLLPLRIWFEYISELRREIMHQERVIAQSPPPPPPKKNKCFEPFGSNIRHISRHSTAWSPSVLLFYHLPEVAELYKDTLSFADVTHFIQSPKFILYRPPHTHTSPHPTPHVLPLQFVKNAKEI